MGDRIELYKTMIGTIIAHEQRRQQVTSVNISLLIAGMAALGGIEGIDPAYIALPAIPLAAIWLFSVQYYRRLAEAKWGVVQELEQHFETQPFTEEWTRVRAANPLVLVGLTRLEMSVPTIILAVSAIYLANRVLALLF
jgi:hypothetical protein